MKKREDIEEKYKWDLTPIYKNDDEALVDMETLKERLELVSKYKGYLGNIDKCLEFLNKNPIIVSMIAVPRNKTKIPTALEIVREIEEAIEFASS